MEAVKLQTIEDRLAEQFGCAFREIGHQFHESSERVFSQDKKCRALRPLLFSCEVPTGRSGMITETKYFMPRWMACVIVSLQYSEGAARHTARLWRRLAVDQELRRAVDTVAVSTGFFDFVDAADFGPHGEGLSKIVTAVFAQYLRVPGERWIDHTTAWTPWPFRESVNGTMRERRADLMRPYLCVDAGAPVAHFDFEALRTDFPQTMDERLWLVPTWVVALVDGLYFDRDKQDGLASSTIAAILRAVGQYERPSEAATAIRTFHAVRNSADLLKDYVVELEALERADIDYGLLALRNARGMLPPGAD